MGCDIFAVVERRGAKGRWKPVRVLGKADLGMPREYGLWCELAGVRGMPVSDEPLAADRGWPEGVTTAAKHETEHCHTISWVGLDEVLCHDWGELDGSVFVGVCRWLSYALSPVRDSDVRIVFGFDS